MDAEEAFGVSQLEPPPTILVGILGADEGAAVGALGDGWSLGSSRRCMLRCHRVSGLLRTRQASQSLELCNGREAI